MLQSRKKSTMSEKKMPVFFFFNSQGGHQAEIDMSRAVEFFDNLDSVFGFGGSI